jgi:hypothetical protein
MRILTRDGWIDGFDWAAVIAGGKSEEITVTANAEAWVEADRKGDYPEYNVGRCAAKGVEVVRAMADHYGWAHERYIAMLAVWVKAYKAEYDSREELESFLRSVGQMPPKPTQAPAAAPAKTARPAIKLQCQECGRRFSRASARSPKCPKCGGYDIDIA